MKLSLFAVIALVTILATTANAEPEFNMTLCKSQLATASKDLKNERDLGGSSNSSPTRLAKAELNSLKIRFHCRDILAADYCQQSAVHASIYLKGIEDALGKGSIAPKYVEEAKFELLKIEVHCR